MISKYVWIYVLAIEDMQNGTSLGEEENSLKDRRKEYTDKSDVVPQHDCIWCMTWVTVYVHHKHYIIDELQGNPFDNLT